MSYTQILLATNDHIGRITLNRPEKRNALTRTAMGEMVQALEAMKADADVQVVVVTGAGQEAFCAGADINEFLHADPLAQREQNEAYRGLCQTLMQFEKPILGAINGLALGGGAGMTLMFDFVIASEAVRFGFPEIRAGIFPMMVAANLFRVIGRRKALELILTGETIDAREAERIGLINRVVSSEELAAEVNKLASTLLRLSPMALWLGKEALHRSGGMHPAEALDYLKEMATVMLLTEDAQAGLEAVLGRKQARWKGR
jgi:enoyl-CoA hydratase/carnithine racemase